MRIATWNVNNVRKRLPQLLAWLEATAPDVVALQELKTETAVFPRAELEKAGYSCLVVGQKSWNGVALLARGFEPIEIRRALPGGPADKQARFVEAAINGVIVACLYLPNGNPQPGPKFQYKLAWFDRLIEHAASLIDSGHPTILAGDFNVVPTDFDIYSPDHWTENALLQPQARAAYELLLAQGWTDALRARFPDERVYTFWDYLRKRWPRNAGLRIDHILLSPGLRLIDAGVDREMRANDEPSDHAPVWSIVERVEPGRKGRHTKIADGSGDKPSSTTSSSFAHAKKSAPGKTASATTFRVTHADRIIDASTGLRKGDLMRYYECVSDRMLPHLRGRPVSLVRAPDGVAGKQFFQKHEESKLAELTKLNSDLWPGHDALLSVDTSRALLSAAQMNVIEFHTWNSLAKNIDKPDRVIFDLDPGEGVTWENVQEAATLTRALLSELGLEAWLKTSGGKGLHVVVPLAPRMDYERVKTFSQAAVRHMAKVIPSRFVAVAGGSRRVGRVFIDYLRNGHAQTTAAAFSARARPGLGVSMPVSWEQLPSLKSGSQWTISTAHEYLSVEKTDPWGAYWTCKQSLSGALKALGVSRTRKEG